MTEDQAYDLAKKAKHLNRLIRRVESDYETLVAKGFIKPIEDLTEFNDVPVFLDLATVLAGDLDRIGNELLSEFG